MGFEVSIILFDMLSPWALLPDLYTESFTIYCLVANVEQLNDSVNLVKKKIE